MGLHRLDLDVDQWRVQGPYLSKVAPCASSDCFIKFEKKTMRKLQILLLYLCTYTCIASDLDLMIIHFNDANSRFQEFSDSIASQTVGGFSRIHSYVKEARNRAKLNRGSPVIFLNAGDNYTGSVWYNVHTWKIVSDFMNLLMPDAMCLGKYEFDGDVIGLAPFVEAAQFPILAANMDTSKESKLDPFIKRSVVLKVRGRKIGIVGYIARITENIGPHGDVHFTDEIEALKNEAKKLTDEGVNIIIGLGSSGFEINKEVAKAVPEIDILVGGGSKVFLWNGEAIDIETPEGKYPTNVAQASGKIVPVVQTSGFTKYLGRVKAVFDVQGNLKYAKGQPVFLHNNMPRDAEGLEVLDKYRYEVEIIGNQTVGKTNVFLSADDCRITECNFGNMICDAFIDYVVGLSKSIYWTRAAIAVINSAAIIVGMGKVRDDRIIRRSSIMRAIPYDSQLVSLTISGGNLLKTLEHAVRRKGKKFGPEFLQMSGLHVVMDYARPPGSRIQSVMVRCAFCDIPEYRPLDKSEDYRIVTTAYVMQGNDGHEVLAQESKFVVYHDMTFIQATLNYLDFYKVVSTGKSDRLIILNDNRSGANLYRLIPSCLVLLCLVFVML